MPDVMRETSSHPGAAYDRPCGCCPFRFSSGTFLLKGSAGLERPRRVRRWWRQVRPPCKKSKTVKTIPVTT